MDPRDSLETRIKDQFPALFITLVSVFVGLALADLVSEARARMVLWPLTTQALITWCELAGNIAAALTCWILYAHIGVSRRGISSLADTLVAFIYPLGLVLGNSTVGLAQTWPWFYFVSACLALSLPTTLWLTQILFTTDADLTTFKHVFRPAGFVSVFALGVLVFALAGWADQNGYLSPSLKLLLVASATPGALLACHIFLKDWHAAIAAVSGGK